MNDNKTIYREALRYHEFPRPGKTAVFITKPCATQHDLTLAYSPGVAAPALAIERNADDSYRYTSRGNLVAVISNGTAVLGLGDIGAAAAKPVMEGKCMLFKAMADVNAFDIEVDADDIDSFVDCVTRIAPTFGGICLEDIKAPECFEIERRLIERLDIPVMHDDQHGTAIISSAALLNALEIQEKRIDSIKLVVNGAGAAAIACTRLYMALGVRRENIVMCDSRGVIRADRAGLSGAKKEFATARDLHTLAEALKDADVFLGLSVADVMTKEMLLSMAPKPIVFALANPDPEIDHDLALATRTDLIFATGRSDFSNQINNVLGFPYIFRGALDCDASEINEAMKLAAARAVAAIAHEPATEALKQLYPDKSLTFGPKYILPKPFDKRLLPKVSRAVAQAADESGVARRPLADLDAYERWLNTLIDRENRYLSELMAHEGAERPKL